ncbi:MAG: geranylgeranylglycerol-phosphate geranylgeranyltransferase [Flavobacteriaceae bacterium]|nr:geranylgeranylglycerol-phosphate geranylgeranyltransferase [Flavobacteriaceae bacterium]
MDNFDGVVKHVSKKKYSIFYKFFSLLSVVRGYNILIIVLAQYLASLFIFSPESSLKDVVFDSDLFLIVFATVCVIAAGYIINNFYDAEKDRINRPLKAKIDSIVNQKTKLNIYFFLNFSGFVLGFIISWKAALFFAVYIFLIWFYSHKLSKYPLTGLISSTVLALLPFFIIFVYYRNFSKVIFAHALFLGIILLIKELLKELENIKGDLLQDYKTVPVAYGDNFTKGLISFLAILVAVPAYFLWKYPEIGYMKYYFYGTGIILAIMTFQLWIGNSKKNYVFLHNVIKLVLIAGVFSLVLIDTSVIIQRIL